MRLPVKKHLPLAALTFLAACGGGARPYNAAQAQPVRGGPSADYPMVLGAPFTVDGVTYTPTDTMNSDAVGHAVVGTDGGNAVSAAHRTLPLPSYVEVTSIETGKTILVRVERRGPMSGKDLIELSPGAAVQLGMLGAANDSVRVRRVNPVEQDRALLRMGQPAPARMDTPKSLLVVLGRKLDLQEGVMRNAPVIEPSPPPVPVPAPSPAPVKDGKSKVKPVPKPAVKPAPKPAPKPTPGPAPAAVPAPATAPTAAPARTTKPAAHGKFLVQVGAFSNRENAQSAAAKIGGSVSAAGKLWRVRMGPFGAEAEAKAALAKAKAAGYSDARIQRAD